MDDDEKLSGFLDRELAEPDRAELAARASRDADTAARLGRMQENDDLVREALSAPLHDPVPARLLEAVDAGLARHAPPHATDAGPRTPANDNPRRWWPLTGAVAASLMVGLVTGSQLAPRGELAAGSVSLEDVLTKTPSAQSVSMASGERVTPQLSFARAGGGYCREFVLASDAGEQTGVACNPNGRWRVVALLPSDASQAADSGYATAAGVAPAAIEEVVGALRGGDPLDVDSEASAIAREWR